MRGRGRPHKRNAEQQESEEEEDDQEEDYHDEDDDGPEGDENEQYHTMPPARKRRQRGKGSTSRPLPDGWSVYSFNSRLQDREKKKRKKKKRGKKKKNVTDPWDHSPHHPASKTPLTTSRRRSRARVTSREEASSALIRSTGGSESRLKGSMSLVSPRSALLFVPAPV
ncbi:hypothetical protein GWK47_021034 [Chionoecetes opilio]|uniref:Uncharacterized protein n=1 Tax=Chionoecetes opilio TaxID=41210 RepID=A0A8J5CKM2_CHIOP|nr:hypothetical protein GWK47_021034 [Chionoecetes opilio]